MSGISKGRRRLVCLKNAAFAVFCSTVFLARTFCRRGSEEAGSEGHVALRAGHLQKHPDVASPRHHGDSG